MLHGILLIIISPFQDIEEVQRDGSAYMDCEIMKVNLALCFADLVEDVAVTYVTKYTEVLSYVQTGQQLG